ncbi:hypothetical protein DIPPA_60609 [Diplonema papillatum]|nr:hypothetical protein DIPPA_60609 [Diplonema papillatum]
MPIFVVRRTPLARPARALVSVRQVVVEKQYPSPPRRPLFPRGTELLHQRPVELHDNTKSRGEFGKHRVDTLSLTAGSALARALHSKTSERSVDFADDLDIEAVDDDSAANSRLRSLALSARHFAVSEHVGPAVSPMSGRAQARMRAGSVARKALSDIDCRSDTLRTLRQHSLQTSKTCVLRQPCTRGKESLGTFTDIYCRVSHGTSSRLASCDSASSCTFADEATCATLVALDAVACSPPHKDDHLKRSIPESPPASRSSGCEGQKRHQPEQCIETSVSAIPLSDSLDDSTSLRRTYSLIHETEMRIRRGEGNTDADDALRAHQTSGMKRDPEVLVRSSASRVSSDDKSLRAVLFDRHEHNQDRRAKVCTSVPRRDSPRAVTDDATVLPMVPVLLPTGTALTASPSVFEPAKCTKLPCPLVGHRHLPLNPVPPLSSAPRSRNSSGGLPPSATCVATDEFDADGIPNCVPQVPVFSREKLSRLPIAQFSSESTRSKLVLSGRMLSLADVVVYEDEDRFFVSDMEGLYRERLQTLESARYLLFARRFISKENAGKNRRVNVTVANRSTIRKPPSMQAGHKTSQSLTSNLESCPLPLNRQRVAGVPDTLSCIFSSEQKAASQALAFSLTRHVPPNCLKFLRSHGDAGQNLPFLPRPPPRQAHRNNPIRLPVI